MKVGDPFKPLRPLGDAAAKAAGTVARGVESLVDTSGKLQREDAARGADTFEKASAPAFAALLDAGKVGIQQGAPTMRAAAASAAGAWEQGAQLLGGLRSELGRLESDTRALMERIDGLRTGGTTAEGTAKGAADLGTTLLDGLAAAADALSRAQEQIAAEASLESMIGLAGRLLKSDTERDIDALSRGLAGLEAATELAKGGLEAGVAVAGWSVEKEAAGARGALGDLQDDLARVESEIKLLLGQIEELRAGEGEEQDAAESGAADDPLAAAAQSVSDAYAAIRDLLGL